MKESRPLVGTYFYPISHSCPVRQARAAELGLSLIPEPELIQTARPLYPGHDQPRAYSNNGHKTVWDDALTTDLGPQVELMRDTGLEFVIFDAYAGARNGVVMQELNLPLNESFLRLEQSKALQFALMFCFSGPRVVFPIDEHSPVKEAKRRYDMNTHTAQYIAQLCMRNYWQKENYLRIGDRPYVSFWVEGVGTNPQKTHQFSEFIEYFRQLVLNTYRIDPLIVAGIGSPEEARNISTTGVDALTGYGLLADFSLAQGPVQQYDQRVAQAPVEWQKIQQESLVPFFPPAVVGWDASVGARSGRQLTDFEETGSFPYPYFPIVENNSPEGLVQMLKQALDYASTNQHRVPLLPITAFNEIRQSSALLPRMREGEPDYAYTQAIKCFLQTL